MEGRGDANNSCCTIVLIILCIIVLFSIPSTSCIHIILVRVVPGECIVGILGQF
jgi:hypothetical protein